ncbi:MAG: hypothetical protein C0617_07785 [Desulfuromonas sp.]|uniref:sensor histidine kinase n=1 Tax=Desulfuromonas sp. TaxID=892 RepID=UPI000CBED59D|nr:ATP-binding protein [Desulfuromonas sp.]PLX84383.1 MAG: hypothetical protein C0617_07785 [Desulfuromonas sp.]
MLKIKFLRNILFLSAALALLFPLFNNLFTYPAYQELLTHETESEAVRYVKYLTHTLGLDKRRLEKGNLPAHITEEVGALRSDALLVKLRVFSPSGEIVHSSVPEEVGTVNRKAYFREIVAKGGIYSKVVQKDSFTAEHQPTTIDVVETYVPIMTEDGFGGAVEVYYDITENRRGVESLTFRSSLLEGALAAAFLVIILLVLSRARKTIEARELAQAELEKAKEELEQRVRERTAQLTESNSQLVQEVAERKKAEDSLRLALEETESTRRKTAGILESVQDGMLVTDGHRRIVMMNPAAEQTLGLQLEKVKGQSIETALRQTSLKDSLGPALKGTGADGHFDFSLESDASRHPRIFKTRTFPLEKSQGSIFLMQDVTGEREVERMKSEFVAMTTHELQTPLTAIMGYSELLMHQDNTPFSPEARKEFIGQIHVQAEALSRIIDDLLNLSQVESGLTLPLKKTVFPVGDLIQQAVDTFRRRSSRHRFEVHLPREQVELEADHGRIAQVLGNLLSNAVKYSPEGGLIKVCGEATEGRYTIAVSDQGMGMSQEQAERAFDLFYRADSSNTALRGTGIGLSIVKQFVEAHGGEVRITSEPGRGTLFQITLPLKTADAAAASG